MPKVTPAHEQKRRAQILRAAMACFARQGYRLTSMEDIVRESGLSIGAIYSYFASKEDLFVALAEARAGQSIEYLGQLFGRAGPMSAKLSEAIDYFFDLLDDSYARVSLEFWSESLTSARLQAQHSSRCQRVREFFLWLLEEAKRRGELRQDVDVPATAELLLALHDGLLLRHVGGVLAVPREDLKRAYIGLLNSALGSPSRPSLISTTVSIDRGFQKHGAPGAPPGDSPALSPDTPGVPL